MRDRMERVVRETLTENYEKYYRLAYSYVHDENDACDIVQEGAYKAILKSGSLKKEEYAGTWIFRIMINEALAFIKKNKRQIKELDSVQASATDSYENLDLKAALSALGDTERAIVILRFFEDMTLTEIADAVGENVSTVKSRLYRALKKLKLTLDDEGGDAYES